MHRRDLLKAAILAVAPRSAAQTTPLALDSNRIPFSRYGSYLTVSNHFWNFGLSDKMPINQFYIRCLQDDPTPPEVFRIALDGMTSADSTPGRLTLRTATGRVEFCILRTRHRPYARYRLQAATPHRHRIVRERRCARQECLANLRRCRPLSGRSPQPRRHHAVDAPWVNRLHNVQIDRAILTFESDFEASLQFFEGVPTPAPNPIPFDQAVAAAEAEFERWAILIDPPKRFAAYVLWSNTVGARGLYRKPVVLGSKNWMARIWSWDHCFAALGLAKSHPALAWQQYILFRDMQDPRSGMLADSMSNIKRSWVCTKNPIHGWTLRHLMRSMFVPDFLLREAYGPLQLWTEYWQKYRNLDNDGLPCILHPDESFDNTTANTMDGPVKAPEIATYLALQMDALADVAQKLKYKNDAARWRIASQALISALLKTLWDDRAQRFLSRRAGDGKPGEGDSLLAFIPLMLGQRLPQNIRATLIAGLKTKGRFLTDYGFATEALTSPLYDGGSYVRGPVWAPMNVFLCEALAQNGEVQLAQTVQRNFVNACQRGGMSEHFDARTGAPQGDPAYIWTAAMYLNWPDFLRKMP